MLRLQHSKMTDGTLRSHRPKGVKRRRNLECVTCSAYRIFDDNPCMLAVMPLTFFRRANERTTIAATDGDSARLLQLLYNGELLTKTVAAAMCAAVEEDSDRRRYTQLYKLVRANGVGDWSRAIDELCVGTTSQHLCLEARTERRDLTVRVAPDSWQFQAVALIDSCLRTLNPQRQGLPPKLEGRSWFTLFAELRNATRGHGALQPAVCAKIAPELEQSLQLMIDRFSLFGREWAYLHKNLSGKFRVVKVSDSDHNFAPLKSSQPDLWGSLQNGLYIFLGRPCRIELMFTDADLTDFRLPNGNFRMAGFETISYLTDVKQVEGSGPYLIPATQLPSSETQGTL
jgi:hypothetical protein